MSGLFCGRCTFQDRGLAGALCRDRGGRGAELSVASPGSDRSLVGQAASCGATLPETLDGSSLDSSSTGHRALTRRNGRGRGGGGRQGHRVENRINKRCIEEEIREELCAGRKKTNVVWHVCALRSTVRLFSGRRQTHTSAGMKPSSLWTFLYNSHSLLR